MKKRIALLGVACLTGSLGAQQVTRDYDRSVDFSGLKKFGWVQRDTLPLFRPDASEHDPVEDARVNRMILDLVKSRLEKKGFIFDEESPDFLVGYIAVAKFSLGSAEFGVQTQGGPEPSYSGLRPLEAILSDRNRCQPEAPGDSHGGCGGSRNQQADVERHGQRHDRRSKKGREESSESREQTVEQVPTGMRREFPVCQ